MMKGVKLSALLCAAGIVLTQSIPALAADSGKGTASEPYIISTAVDFADIAHNPSGNYILTQDIVIESGLENTAFSGTLDGNGYRIRLNGEKPLFNSVSGSVKNLSLDAYNVSEGFGILADKLTGAVTQCNITGQTASVNQEAENLGGIAGVIDGGTVTDSIVSAYIEGSAKSAGEIAGTANNAKITNCFVRGTITASGSAVASVIGTAENSSISGVYYDKGISNLPYGISIGSDSTTSVNGYDELRRASSYPALNFGSVWTIIEGASEPMLVVHNGQGTSAKPYRIHTIKDYKTIIPATYADSKYYRLENDIDIDSQTGSSDNPFNGHFDGGNHEISYSGGGIFKVVGEGSVVENIRRNISAYGSEVVGGIADINYGTVKKCYVYGSIRGSKDCGGVVGENIGGTVSDSYFDGSVNVSRTGAGGIVGYNSYGTIEDCGARVELAGSDHGIGGVTGDNSFGVIKNSYATGSLTGGTEVGGISGRVYNGSVVSSYANCSVSGSSDIGGIFGAQFENAYVENSYYVIRDNASDKMNADQKSQYGRADAAMKAQSTYAGFDFSGVWGIDEGVDTPVLKNVNGSGTRDNPYIIRTSSEFKKIKENRRLYYELGNDISFSGSVGAFTGSLNGKGHTITKTDSSSPLFSELGDGAYVGNVHVKGKKLVNTATNAAIEYCTLSKGDTVPAVFAETLNNTTVRNCKVIGAKSLPDTAVAGGFVNTVTGGTITDSTVVDSTVNGSNVAGGFAGITSGTSITDSIVYNTSVSGATAGGFVGRNDNGSSITNSSFEGTVNGGSYTGTFAGMNYASISSSTGIVKTSEEDAALEFVGYDNGTVTGAVTSSNSDTYKIIPTGGIYTNVNVPTLAAEEKAATSTVTLSDISGHWAEATIKKLVGKGVINGYEDGTYRPQNSVTKSEFITLLLAATNTRLQDGFTGYEDVNKHWAKNQVNTAILLGITDNIAESAASFGVDKAITRAEAVALMGRLIAKGESGTLNFTDNADIPDWAKNEVGACVSKGIINGMDDGSFAPNKSLTRAESAIIIDKLMELK